MRINWDKMKAFGRVSGWFVLSGMLLTFGYSVHVSGYYVSGITSVYLFNAVSAMFKLVAGK